MTWRVVRTYAGVVNALPLPGRYVTREQAENALAKLPADVRDACRVERV